MSYLLLLAIDRGKCFIKFVIYKYATFLTILASDVVYEFNKKGFLPE